MGITPSAEPVQVAPEPQCDVRQYAVHFDPAERPIRSFRAASIDGATYIIVELRNRELHVYRLWHGQLGLVQSFQNVIQSVYIHHKRNILILQCQQPKISKNALLIYNVQQQKMLNKVHTNSNFFHILHTDILLDGMVLDHTTLKFSNYRVRSTEIEAHNVLIERSFFRSPTLQVRTNYDNCIIYQHDHSFSVSTERGDWSVTVELGPIQTKLGFQQNNINQIYFPSRQWIVVTDDACVVYVFSIRTYYLDNENFVVLSRVFPLKTELHHVELSENGSICLNGAFYDQCGVARLQIDNVADICLHKSAFYCVTEDSNLVRVDATSFDAKCVNAGTAGLIAHSGERLYILSKGDSTLLEITDLDNRRQ